MPYGVALKEENDIKKTCNFAYENTVFENHKKKLI